MADSSEERADSRQSTVDSLKRKKEFTTELAEVNGGNGERSWLERPALH
jgi:hypothetical protein